MKSIIICGSISASDEMIETQKQLEQSKIVDPTAVVLYKFPSGAVGTDDGRIVIPVRVTPPAPQLIATTTKPAEIIAVTTTATTTTVADTKTVMTPAMAAAKAAATGVNGAVIRDRATTPMENLRCFPKKNADDLIVRCMYLVSGGDVFLY